MTTFQEVRLADLCPALTVTKGFPTSEPCPTATFASCRWPPCGTPRRRGTSLTERPLTTSGLEVAQPGDVLVAIEGGTVGETLVVPDGIEDFVPSQQAATLRVVDTTRLDPWYLGAWLTTEPAR